MTEREATELSAVGDMMKLTGATRKRIERAIEALGVKPSARVGATRLFGPGAVRAIRERIDELDARRASA